MRTLLDTSRPRRAFGAAVAMTALLTGLILTGAATTAHAADTITMPDPSLLECVNDELGQPTEDPVTVTEMESLTSLDCGWYDVLDLTGIEHATNLEELRFSWSLDIGNSDHGIEPLAGLTKLVELDLEMTNLRDISPLAGLRNLQTLLLGDNILDNQQLVHLSGLTDLRVLSITGNDVTDLSSLASLTQLRELYSQFNPVTSVEPLAELTNLEVLYLNYGTAITDISPLAGLTKLTEVGIDDQRVQLTEATAGIAEPNPVRSLDGSPVPSGSEHYQPDDNTFVFTTPDDKVTTEWETEVQIGNTTTVFSGTLTRDVTEPAPVFDPTATVTPATVTLAELADTGVTITGSEFPANTEVDLGLGDSTVDTSTTDADGNVAFAYVTDTLPAGEHTAVLRAGDLTAEAAFTIAPDPVYDPKATVTPTTITRTDLADTGVTITGTGFPATVDVVFTIAGETVTTRTSDSDGSVSFRYITDALDAGEHTVSLTAAGQTAQAGFTVTTDPDNGPDLDPDTDTGGSGPGEDTTDPSPHPSPDDGAPSGNGLLPATGAPALTAALAVAALLLVAGGGLVIRRS